MVLADIAEYLEAQGIGTRGTNLFYGILEETPDAVVTMYEYPGVPNEPNLGKDTINLENPRVQIVVRGTANDYDNPRSKARDIVTALAKVANESISSGGVQYKAISHLNGPSFMKRDANFRVLFTINYQVMKEYGA